MNNSMAYLLGMILGNGEIQRGRESTRITIDIPYKNLRTDDNKDIAVYVSASVWNIQEILNPLIGVNLQVSNNKHSTDLSFSLPNGNYILSEINRLTNMGIMHTTMQMSPDLFSITTDQKKSLLRGFADVTGYVRLANDLFGQEGAHRVYLEVPKNWQMVIDICNMLKDVDVPVQTIDFGHPNFRDGNLTKYNQGYPNFWKKEHQIKIFVNEFLPIGFNIKHKQEALERLSRDLLLYLKPSNTHKFYWEKTPRIKLKPHHPGEDDSYLPTYLQHKHFDSWTELAEYLGYKK